MSKSVFVLLLCLSLFTAFQINAAENFKWAYIFNLEDLLLDVTSHNDGIQGGAGAKFWLGKNLALRCLLNLDVLRDMRIAPVQTLTTFGASGAIEYHPLTEKVSPYMGGLIGLHIYPNYPLDQNQMDFYVAGIFGVEVEIKSYFSFYAEYALRALFTPDEYTITLGTGNNTQLGILFYINR